MTTPFKLFVDGITSMMTGIETNSERTIMSVLVLNEQTRML